jgi:hypothetical protein
MVWLTLCVWMCLAMLIRFRNCDRNHVYHLAAVDWRDVSAGAERVLSLLLQHEYCLWAVCHVSVSLVMQGTGADRFLSAAVSRGSSYLDGKW